MLGVSGIITQMLQIASDYSGLPDIRTMELWEVRFFYYPLIPSLIEAQKKAKKKWGKNENLL